MNFYKLLTHLSVLLITINTIVYNALAQCTTYSYTAPTASTAGNPRGLTWASKYTLGSTTYTFGSDASTAGWSSVSFPTLGSTNTSSTVTIPSGFSFSFYGETVTGFKASYNGIVKLIGPSETSVTSGHTISISTSTFTTSDNSSLPSSLISYNSICCWDQYFTAKNVYYGVFESSGTTKYKQVDCYLLG